MEEETYNPTITVETNEEILQNGVLEEVITVDQEFTEKKEVFHETKNALQKNLEQNTITTDNIGDPLEEYFKNIKNLSSWMNDIVNSTLSSPAFLPLNTTFVTDLDILNSSEEDLSKIELDIIKLSSNVERVEVEIKNVEAKLEGVEESRKKRLDDDGGGDNPSPFGSSIIESSSDITVTGMVFSSSLLDEWYTKVVAAEESVQEVDSKVKEVESFLQHERFRSPKDLSDHINIIINNNVPELRSKVASAKQALAHDRRIARWFDAANDADKSINVTLNRLKQLEIPDFINKREWTDEEQNLTSIIDDRINDIKAINSESQKIKSDKIDDLDKKANEIIITIKNSADNEVQTVVDLMTKQLRNLNNRLTKLDNFIELLLSQTTIDRYSVVLKLLSSMESMRNQMTQIRKTLIEHNDADLVMGDVIDVE
ncbi:hypothetical protein RhiirA5_402728, partial [Rhizophagus irregularis]